ncbi:similar to Saccharomyces cerevisiae YJL171C GPI-anchored cell wall protein of unknown function [Maudiozyma saulgeensis]|uniref:glucan endo-1,3-beta-D-glucosidase n=1 Tax=Maudiozyma saulgeensis TaxID=1789683 RepID=A0A1X7RB65_9SACH|nr:similar to Saccharomyces cerevisiae YJL171C GPI-anchored cell wall protein of unknown function [Kazachstania saulgeensis]
MLLRYFLLVLNVFSFVIAIDNVGTSGKLRFSNLGYADTFNYVGKISNITRESCSCTLAPPAWFSGTNAPLSERLVAHIRGPTQLYKFAYYNVHHFILGSDNNTHNWTQQALFDIAPDSISKQGINVTFLGHKGKYSPCMGKALTFIGQDAVSFVTENPDPTGFSGYVPSNEEFIIYSNFPCPSSKVGGLCGVYRKGIRSYTGYEGVTKLFLFEFSMPTDTNITNQDGKYYDMPSIWLANEHLSRTTEHYDWNNNCSCLFNGCGAYQAFTTNSTDHDLLYSSLQTFQGINKNASQNAILNGTFSTGRFNRPRNTTVRGGVLFDSAGNIVTFITNNTVFHEELTPEQVEDMLSDIPNIGKELVLPSGTLHAPNKTSSSGGSTIRPIGLTLWAIYLSLITSIIQFLII